MPCAFSQKLWIVGDREWATGIPMIPANPNSLDVDILGFSIRFADRENPTFVRLDWRKLVERVGLRSPSTNFAVHSNCNGVRTAGGCDLSTGLWSGDSDQARLRRSALPCKGLKMGKLEVSVGKTVLKNPLIAGSAEHLIEADGVRRAVRAGAGAVGLKSVNESGRG